MGTPLIERTEKILGYVRQLLPEEPRYIFVSEYRDDEGNRNYESLWVLSDNFISEAKQFVSQSEFDLTSLSGGLTRILISNHEFEFENASESSRLSVYVNLGNTGSAITGSFRASGTNCNDLNQVLTEYLLPLAHTE